MLNKELPSDAVTWYNVNEIMGDWCLRIQEGLQPRKTYKARKKSITFFTMRVRKNIVCI